MKYWFKLFSAFFDDPVILAMEKQDAKLVTTYQKMLLQAIKDDDGIINFHNVGKSIEEEIGATIHVTRNTSKKTIEILEKSGKVERIASGLRFIEAPLFTGKETKWAQYKRPPYKLEKVQSVSNHIETETEIDTETDKEIDIETETEGNRGNLKETTKEEIQDICKQEHIALTEMDINTFLLKMGACNWEISGKPIMSLPKVLRSYEKDKTYLDNAVMETLHTMS